MAAPHPLEKIITIKTHHANFTLEKKSFTQTLKCMVLDCIHQVLYSCAEVILTFPLSYSTSNLEGFWVNVQADPFHTTVACPYVWCYEVMDNDILQYNS